MRQSQRAEGANRRVAATGGYDAQSHAFVPNAQPRQRLLVATSSGRSSGAPRLAGRYLAEPTGGGSFTIPNLLLRLIRPTHDLAHETPMSTEIHRDLLLDCRLLRRGSWNGGGLVNA